MASDGGFDAPSVRLPVSSPPPEPGVNSGLIREADEISETLRIVAGQTDAIPEGDVLKTRLLAAKYRLREAKNALMEVENQIDGGDKEEEVIMATMRTELERCSAILTNAKDVYSFWVGLANDQNTATRLLHSLLVLAIKGNTDVGFDSAHKFKERYLSSHGYRKDEGNTEKSVGRYNGSHDKPHTTKDMHAACSDMTTYQSSVSFTTGFTTGFGGLLTLPITLPCTLVANITVNLRLAFAIAMAGGHDVSRPAICAAAIDAALGFSDANETCEREGITSTSLDPNAVNAGELRVDLPSTDSSHLLDPISHDPSTASSKRLIDRSVADAAARAAMRGNGAVLQGGAWRLARSAAARLVTKGATRGGGIAAARAIPLLGGFVGGGFDAYSVSTAGRRAKKRFLPPIAVTTHKNTSTSYPSPPKSPQPQNAFETVGAGFVDAFQTVSVSLTETFEQASKAMRDGSAGLTGNNHTDEHRMSYQSGSYQTGGGLETDGTRYKPSDINDVTTDFDFFSEHEARWERDATERAAEKAEAMARNVAALDDARRKLLDESESSSSRKESKKEKKLNKKESKRLREVQQTLRWATHETKWVAFLGDDGNSKITVCDVPWPPSTKHILKNAAAAESGGLSEGLSDEELKSKNYRRAYKRLMLRWHSDKFAQRFSHRIDDLDFDLVITRVGEVTSAVVEQWNEFQTTQR